MRARPFAVLIGLLLGLLLATSSRADRPQQISQPTGAPQDLFTVPDADLGNPLVFVVYGDMRFTDPGETEAAAPGPRRALVTRVAAEHPDALFLTGDIPWRGGQPADYRVYTEETASWQDEHLRIYPVLGNHEFSQCAEAECLENWWQAFPPFRGRRWYAVALGTSLRAFALDSNASLRPGGEQRKWFEHEIETLPGTVRFVLVVLHHPPVADQSLLIVRSNERALSAYLRLIAHRTSRSFVVCGAHVHNYERFERDGIVYLVSGGGGAKPLAVRRGAHDLYRDPGFPNFHYLRFELQGERLTADMIRLEDYGAPAPHTWKIKDHFEVLAKSPKTIAAAP